MTHDQPAPPGLSPSRQSAHDPLARRVPRGTDCARHARRADTGRCSSHTRSKVPGPCPIIGSSCETRIDWPPAQYSLAVTDRPAVPRIQLNRRRRDQTRQRLRRRPFGATRRDVTGSALAKQCRGSDGSAGRAGRPLAPPRRRLRTATLRVALPPALMRRVPRRAHAETYECERPVARRTRARESRIATSRPQQPREHERRGCPSGRQLVKSNCAAATNGQRLARFGSQARGRDRANRRQRAECVRVAHRAGQQRALVEVDVAIEDQVFQERPARNDCSRRHETVEDLVRSPAIKTRAATSTAYTAVRSTSSIVSVTLDVQLKDTRHSTSSAITPSANACSKRPIGRAR